MKLKQKKVSRGEVSEKERALVGDKKVLYCRGAVKTREGEAVVATTAEQRLNRFADWLEKHAASRRFIGVGSAGTGGVEKEILDCAEDIRALLGELNLLRLDVVMDRLAGDNLS